MNTNVYFWSCLAQLFLEWAMFETSVVEKTKHTFCVQNFFFENRAVYKKIWKNRVRAGQATEDSMSHAHWMLYT